MNQQIHVNGYIDVPEHWSFPDIDQRLELHGVIVEVRGDKTRKNKTSGEASALKHTLDTVMLSGASVGKVLPAAPIIEGQATLDEPETVTKLAGRRASPKTPAQRAAARKSARGRKRTPR